MTHRSLLPAFLATAALTAVALTPGSPARADAAVTNLADSGPGSLRAAIEAANAAPAGFTITFAVAGRIPLASALPEIRNAVTIDGTTAPGYAGAPVVQIDNNGNPGLQFASAARTSVLNGLSITGASGAGVTISSAVMSVVGNYIGLTPAGAAAGNGGDGILLTEGSTDNQIGANGAEVSGAFSNVISGNVGSGIRLLGSTENTIQANRIGTDPTGTTAVPNQGDGITLDRKSRSNLIGGTVFTDSATGETNNPTGSKGTVTPVFVVPPLGNLVSGNATNGIRIAGGSGKNTLNGNFVGTTADGDDGLGNGANGVLVVDSNKTTLQGCRFQNEPFVYYNIMSDNGRNGLRIHNSDDTTVQANFFGVGANNTALLGNAKNGILVDGDSADTQVGGVIPLGNVSADNGANGIAVKGKASGFTTFNTFGGLLAFKGAAANADNGLLITATGGDQLVRTNVFSGNDGNGIELAGRATGVTIDPNIVGLNTKGNGFLSNGGSGVVVTDKAHHNTIGGNRRSVIPQNTFSGNDGYGLVINGQAHHNTVFNTYVGSDVLGSARGNQVRVGNEKGGVLFAGNARDNRIGYSGGKKVNKLVSGNDGPGVTLRRGTRGNQILGTYIGLGRGGRCLVNEGANVIDRGRNTVRGNYYCSPDRSDGDRPTASGRG